MSFTAGFLQKLKALKVSAFTIYPVVIILLIPALLIVNTYWNLRSFNRDANFIVRHQAVSIAEILKPQIEQNKDLENLGTLLFNVTSSNEDILAITIFEKSGSEFSLYITTDDENKAKNLSGFQLNQLAGGFNEPFAALTFDPNLQRNIWNVVVPLTLESNRLFLLNFQLDTKSVSEILSRTSRDSFVILSILVVVTLVLLANHFYFYLRSLRTKQLEELERLKDEFISMAAHELRAPITAITGYLDMLRGEIKGGNTASINEEITTLTALTRDLNGLVEDLLDVSRIEQGRIKVEMKDTNISEIVENVMTIMTPTAIQKNLKLVFEKSKLPVVKTDPDRVRQIVTNLVSNSIKYTLQGEVKIKVEADNKFIKITVRDTGVGIPPEEMVKLFGKFHRVKDRLTSEVRGTGLGLWITRKLVELLGGKINVESIYGTGSSFTFTIPITT